MLPALGMLIAAGLLVHRTLTLVTVSGFSMSPTYGHGARLIGLRTNRLYSRRAVVIAKDPGLKGPGTLVVKRLVGLPGDQLVFRNSSVSRLVAESAHNQGSDISVSVGDGMVFLQGDSDISFDSRAWGPVPRDLLVGRVLVALDRGMIGSSSDST